MERSLWQQVDALFEQLLELPQGRRRARLDELGPAPAVRAAVERLLAADTLAKSFLEARTAMLAAAQALPPAEPEGELPGRLGPYKILGVLGSGGMGQVLLAARADDQFERLVAIKRIRANLPGPRRDELLARFQLERQALAQLEHPHIARLYDAGQDEQGDPYLVLEHVDGVPIDVYCDHHRLSIAERLELFRQVCAAVGFAHRGLVVHRDLKPSNILVTAEGRPILLDFGIAKWLDGQAESPAAAETRTGARPMTPGYASPEQVKGLPITTATDVYSLGVLLYELLTGRRPYRLTSSWRHELEKAICEEEPERPSTAVLRAAGFLPTNAGEASAEPPRAEVAERRATTPRGLARQLRGDLDTLLAKALRKEPAERYVSVEAMAEDIRRYLQAEPLAARPPQLADRLGKFWRRHRLGVSLAALFLIALATFVALLVAQGRHIRRERDKAERALAFLVEVFRASDPAEARGAQLRARDILDAGAARIDRELGDQPDVQATLMDAMGQVYLRLGLLPSAEKLLGQALAQREGLETIWRDPAEIAATRLKLCELALAQGRHRLGEERCRQALAELAPGPSLERARGLDLLGTLVHYQERSGEALALRKEALAMVRTVAPGSGLDVDYLSALAGTLIADRQFDAADAAVAEVLKQSWRADVESSVAAATSLQKLGDALLHVGDSEHAEAVFRRALAIQQKLLDPGHPALLETLQRIATVLVSEDDFATALELQQQVYAQRKERLGPEHPMVADVLGDVGISLAATGKFEEGVDCLRRAMAMTRKLHGRESGEELRTLMALAAIHRRAKKLDEAEPIYQQALAAYARFFGEEDYEYSIPLVGLARLRADQGRLAEAIPLYRRGLALRHRVAHGAKWRISSLEAELGDVLSRHGDHLEGERWLIRGHNAMLEQYGPRTYMLEAPLRALAELYERSGRDADAAAARAALDDPAGRRPWSARLL